MKPKPLMPQIILSGCCILLLLALFLLTQNYGAINSAGGAGAKNSSALLLRSPDGSVLECEAAVSEPSRQAGLMNRTYLCPDCCMLFVFDYAGRYGFWMKNTLIPLDLVFLDANLTVNEVKENFEPCRKADCPAHYPQKDARYVVEANAGQAAKRGITAGAQMEFFG